jgi:hypothetical protein
MTTDPTRQHRATAPGVFSCCAPILHRSVDHQTVSLSRTPHRPEKAHRRPENATIRRSQAGNKKQYISVCHRNGQNSRYGSKRAFVRPRHQIGAGQPKSSYYHPSASVEPSEHQSCPGQHHFSLFAYQTAG